MSAASTKAQEFQEYHTILLESKSHTKEVLNSPFISKTWLSVHTHTGPETNGPCAFFKLNH